MRGSGSNSHRRTVDTRFSANLSWRCDSAIWFSQTNTLGYFKATFRKSENPILSNFKPTFFLFVKLARSEDLISQSKSLSPFSVLPGCRVSVLVFASLLFPMRSRIVLVHCVVIVRWKCVNEAVRDPEAANQKLDMVSFNRDPNAKR